MPEEIPFCHKQYQKYRTRFDHPERAVQHTFRGNHPRTSNFRLVMFQQCPPSSLLAVPIGDTGKIPVALLDAFDLSARNRRAGCIAVCKTRTAIRVAGRAGH
jgi:hypothetical protein